MKEFFEIIVVVLQKVKSLIIYLKKKHVFSYLFKIVILLFVLLVIYLIIIYFLEKWKAKAKPKTQTSLPKQPKISATISSQTEPSAQIQQTNEIIIFYIKLVIQVVIGLGSLIGAVKLINYLAYTKNMELYNLIIMFEIQTVVALAFWFCYIGSGTELDPEEPDILVLKYIPTVKLKILRFIPKTIEFFSDFDRFAFAMVLIVLCQALFAVNFFLGIYFFFLSHWLFFFLYVMNFIYVHFMFFMFMNIILLIFQAVILLPIAIAQNIYAFFLKK